MSDQHHDEDGAVLLTTLLMMSIMASLAISIMDDVTSAIRRTTAMQNAAQATHYLSGAESYALSYIGQQLEGVDPASLNIALRDAEPIIFPIDDGAITLRVSDGSNCRSPSDVLIDSEDSRMTNLFRLAGLDPSQAQSIFAALHDWQDADQDLSPGGAEDGHYLNQTPAYRTANTPISALTELRAIRDVTPDAYALIQPYLCLRGALPGEPSTININTMTAADVPLLASVLGKDINFATTVLAMAPQMGWDADSFANSPILLDQQPADGFGFIEFEPQVLRVDIRVDYRNTSRASRLMVSLIDNIRVVHRESGEAVAPIRTLSIDEDEEAETENER